MPSLLEQAGAAREQSSFAPLHTDRMFTGYFTNRNVLRDGASTEYQVRYGGGRIDAIFDGKNVEISPHLTLIRRPGLDVYKAGSFPAVTSFFSFHQFSTSSETITVLADTQTDIYDVTKSGSGGVVFHKAGTGRAYFLGVGNTLYITDGAENKQIVFAEKTWTANTRYYMGDRVSVNGHIWTVAGFQWVGISSASVSPAASGNTANVSLGSTPAFPQTEPIQIIASNQPNLNEQGFAFQWTSATAIVFSSLPLSVQPFPSQNIGGFVASTRAGGGVSGSDTSPFNTANIVIGDGEILWKNDGPAVSDMGIQPPQIAPTVSQAAIPNPYDVWHGPWFYEYVGTGSNTPYVIGNSSGFETNANAPVNVPATEPAWPPNEHDTITDANGNLWINMGSTDWAANRQQQVGSFITDAAMTSSGFVTFAFRCVRAGQTGATRPTWLPGLGQFITDNQVLWENVGFGFRWTDIGGKELTNVNVIVDSNGYIEKLAYPGYSGATAPAWKTLAGAITTDNQVQWKNAGPWSVAGTGPVRYGYAYKKNSTGDISNMSPPSAYMTAVSGMETIVSGPGDPNYQVGDTIIVYRTAQGGSTFLKLAEIQGVASGQTWNFIDNSIPDSGLDVTEQAQVGGEGTPLPLGAGPMAYHLGRTFVGVGNVIWVSSGPDAIASTSSGNTGFDTFFTVQSKITRFWVTPIGLVVFTVNDSYIVLGSATDSDPLYVTGWIPDLPLLNYDCFCEYMTAGYIYTGQQVVKKLDPAAGILDISFPVADQLEKVANAYDPANSCLTFHTQGSNENAIYLSNRAGQWLRMSATSSPETGSNWNPPAVFSTAYGAVQSIEVAPGVFRLLVGPGAAAGPILERNPAVATDNGTAYAGFAVFGSITLCEPGQISGLAFLTLESTIQGSAPLLSLLIGEIAGTFESLKRTRQDPPLLPPSTSIRGDRFSLLQDQRPVWCRHFQFRIDWPAENAFNELLTFTIFGEVRQERGGS
jgi:hypothetical protein